MAVRSHDVAHACTQLRPHGPNIPFQVTFCLTLQGQD